MQDFTKLKVWQKAHNFTVNLYKITKDFPSDEKFGLTNQIRRASQSLTAQVATQERRLLASQAAQLNLIFPKVADAMEIKSLADF